MWLYVPESVGSSSPRAKSSGPRYRCVCYVERDPPAVAVLRARIADGRLDDAPIHGDLCSFDGKPWRGVVDFISAGFPCQPFSTASRGRKVAVDLWPSVARVVSEIEPSGVFCENVQREPIERAARELAALGYRVRYTRVTSAHLGAPHRRVRWWLFADADHEGESVLAVDAEVARVPAAARALWSRRPDRILGMDDGLSGRMDRLRMLGNSAMPQMGTAALAWLLKS